jgi:hypothetical protein
MEQCCVLLLAALNGQTVLTIQNPLLVVQSEAIFNLALLLNFIHIYLFVIAYSSTWYPN